MYLNKQLRQLSEYAVFLAQCFLCGILKVYFTLSLSFVFMVYFNMFYLFNGFISMVNSTQPNSTSEMKISNLDTLMGEIQI